MLVQLAMIVLAFCAMLSLIIDVGYARITQGQMQGAVDTAALEGLRQRDSAGEAGRRSAAAALAGYTFDQNFDTTDVDPDYDFGAGPIIDLTGGITTLHGAELASVPDPHVYKPVLQPNLGDATEGDMVSGRFCYNAAPGPSEGGVYEDEETVCGQAQRGAGAYSRNDFNPGGAGANAFLVRMRRSNDFQDQAAQVEEDVASSGPPLPLTFGKATTIFADDPGGGYSVRRDGLTVRATGIAETRPVVHLGATQPGAPAMAPFALFDACVQTATGAATTIPVSINQTTGVIGRLNAPGATATCAANAVVGRFIVAAAPAPVPAALRTIGALLPAAVARPCQSLPATIATAYAPVFSQMANNQMRIIGYARASLTRQATCPGAGRGGVPPFTATIVRAASAIAPSNATGVFVGGLPVGVPAAILTELLAKNVVANGTANYAPVLAPVLAR